MLCDAPKSGVRRERVFNLGLETLWIVIRGESLDQAPNVGRSFSYGSVVSYQPEEEIGAVLFRGGISPYPGHRCAKGACLLDTSRGCLRYVTPDALSSSPFRLIRVMPLVGSARYEHWLLIRMSWRSGGLRSMRMNDASRPATVLPQIPLRDSRPTRSRRRSGSHFTFPVSPPDVAGRH